MCKDLLLDSSYPALVIFDVFKGQCTPTVLQMLKDYNILYVTVPNNCTVTATRLEREQGCKAVYEG